MSARPRLLPDPLVRTLAALALLGGLAFGGRAAAAESVDLELVLAVDISFSMDEDEQRLQRLGYIHAITSPEVMAAIRSGLTGAIALTYVEWAGAAEQRVVVGWTRIDDEASAQRFVAALAEAPRKRVFRTSIAEAIAFATVLFDDNGYDGLRRVIDVSGDGPNNQGRLVTSARDRAIERGITINGLPLLLKRSLNSYFDIPDLDAYYEHCVVGGPSAFSIPVRDMETFAEAVRRKLVLEIAGAESAGRPAVIPAGHEGPAELAQQGDGSGGDLCTIGERIWRQRMGN